MGAEAKRFGLVKREVVFSPKTEALIAPLRREKSLGRFFDSVNELAIKRYLQNKSPEFLRYRQEIEMGLSKRQIKKVLFDQDMKGAKPGTAKYDRLIAVSSLREQIKREIIRKVLEKGENRLGLTEAERIVLLANCDIADQTDVFYRKWSLNDSRNPLTKKLRLMAPEERTKFLKRKKVIKSGDEYVYSDLKEEGDKVIKIPYAVAYEEEVNGIARIIKKMCSDLDKVKKGKGAKNAKHLATYYRSYAKALTSTNTEAHEKLWKQVDENWLAIRGRMQPIHMMESYVDPAGLRVDPDISLMFLDDRYQNLTNKANRTKNKMIDWLVGQLKDYKSALKSEKSMRSALVGMFNPAVIGGRRHAFRPAGQNIPNREGVRLHGVKIFLDVETMRQRWHEEKELLEKIFGKKETARLFKEKKMIDTGMGVIVAGHEVAHNLFIVKGTRKTIGTSAYQNLEEHKSTHAITSAAGEILPRKHGFEEQKQLLLYLFASSLRSIALKGDESRKPYYYDALVCLNLMSFCQVVKNDDGHITFDFSKRGVGQFFKLAEDLLTHNLAQTYDKKSPKLAKKYIGDFFTEGGLVQDLLKRIAPSKKR